MSAWQRVRQLLSALTAKLSETDKCYVQARLEPELQNLFFAMTKGDQLHAVKVAYTAERLAKEICDSKIDHSLLQRCALLHDIGRGYEAGTPWAKTLAVLVRKLAPEWCLQQSAVQEGEGGYLHRIIYRHYLHPQVGAEILKENGFYREAELVAKHHQKATKDDKIELRLLRQADEVN